MKVLFVCKANIGRSQMAEAFFNKISKKNKAASGGTNATREGKKLEMHPLVIKCMLESGIDLRKNKPKKITLKMVKESVIVVIMDNTGDFPDYINKAKKIIYWNIENPKETNLDFHRKTRDEIRKKVEELVNEIG